MLSNKKSLSGSIVWVSWFILIDYISFSRFYTLLGNEIETKTSSFKNAGVGPFLMQEARWTTRDTYSLRTILTLSTWGGTIFHFRYILVSIFTLNSRFSVFGNWSFRPSDLQSLSKWRERLVLLFLWFQKPWFGACVHIGSMADAMFLKGGDWMVTKVIAKRRSDVD